MITRAGTLLLASRAGRAGLEACLALLRAQHCLVEVWARARARARVRVRF